MASVDLGVPCNVIFLNLEDVSPVCTLHSHGFLTRSEEHKGYVDLILEIRDGIVDYSFI